MPWQFWLGLVLGSIAFGPLGFIIGRAVGPAGEAPRTIAREDAADERADRERSEIEAELQQRIEQTLKADAEELRDALNNDFNTTLAPDGVRSERPK
jgi:hypothetical protein